jgi:hypothetical protein
MFELVDGTFRAYKKKNGNISLHLKTYLLVYTNLGFRLSAYLKDLNGWLKLPRQNEIEIEQISYSDALVCSYTNDTMVHHFWLSTVLTEKDIKPCVADLRIMLHLSFTGHSYEKPKYLTKKVFVVPVF